MKYAKFMLGGLVAITATANAMPTPEQTKKVEPLVQDLMKDDQAALKSGKKTRVEVAQSAMELADKADSEAAKLLLMKGAFNLYVRAGEFDKAIETLQSLQAAIPDLPPANMAGIIESSLRAVSRKNGGQLYRLLDETKTRMRYTTAAKSLEKSVKQNPADRALRTKLAEHYAYLGQWDKALENFAATDGKVGAIAKSEREGDAATEKIADFWWSYPTGKAEELVKCFRTHAAKLYGDAIAYGKITGLSKVQAERRIEEAKEYGENIFETNVGAAALRELTFTLHGQFGDVIVDFVPCRPGTFEMGYDTKKAKVSITRQFWMSKIHFSRKQWRACWDMKRGSGSKNYALQQMMCEAVTGDSFETPMQMASVTGIDMVLDDMNKMLKKELPKGFENYVFRLPTEAEWEYAIRFNSKDLALNTLDVQEPELSKYFVTTAEKRKIVEGNENIKKRFGNVSDDELREVPGPSLMKKTNRSWFGVCDIFNGRSEVFLDRIDGNGLSFLQSEDNVSGKDVFHWTDEKKFKAVRRRYDGKFGKFDRPCYNGDALHGSVFRIVIGPDLVGEWRARNKK